jgi:hypothetical protein
MPLNRNVERLRKGYSAYRTGRELVGSVDDDFNGFRTLTETFVRGVLEKYLFPLRVVKWVALGLMVLLVVGAVSSFQANETILGVLALILAAVAGLVWWLLRAAFNFVERQLTKALRIFDRKVSEGAAQVRDWPNWYKSWKQKKV